MKRLLICLVASAAVLVMANQEKKSAEVSGGTPQVTASQQDVTAAVAFAQQDSATFAATETAAYVDTGQMPIDTSPAAIEVAVYYVDTGALTDQIQASNETAIEAAAMKIDVNTATSAPSQPDHPAARTALAKRYGEQACMKKDMIAKKFSSERVVQKT
jgi:hypothetical protein